MIAQTWRREPRGYYTWTGLLHGRLVHDADGSTTIALSDCDLSVNVRRRIDEPVLLKARAPEGVLEVEKEIAHEQLLRMQVERLGCVCWPPLVDSGVV